MQVGSTGASQWKTGVRRCFLAWLRSQDAWLAGERDTGHDP